MACSSENFFWSRHRNIFVCETDIGLWSTIRWYFEVTIFERKSVGQVPMWLFLTKKLVSPSILTTSECMLWGIFHVWCVDMGKSILELKFCVGNFEREIQHALELKHFMRLQWSPKTSPSLILPLIIIFPLTFLNFFRLNETQCLLCCAFTSYVLTLSKNDFKTVLSGKKLALIYFIFGN